MGFYNPEVHNSNGDGDEKEELLVVDHQPDKNGDLQVIVQDRDGNTYSHPADEELPKNVSVKS